MNSSVDSRRRTQLKLRHFSFIIDQHDDSHFPWDFEHPFQVKEPSLEHTISKNLLRSISVTPVSSVYA